MTATTKRLAAAVEDYLTYLHWIRASGGATAERSNYTPLATLLNAVGGSLRPKVFCVGEPADLGAGHPDFGLYAKRQVQRDRPRAGQAPECGVVEEVKPPADDAWLTAESSQVSRYWERYRLVLVTNMRDFVLVGQDAVGRPARLETFRLAESAEAFGQRLEAPRVFAREVAAGFGEYLCRALSHRARLAEPKDLAWLLASYARDPLARVEAAGAAPSLTAVRSALEEALGVRFEGDRGTRFFRSTLVQTLFYGVFSAWVLWARTFRRRPAPSTGARRCGTCVRRSSGRCFSNSPTLAACNRSLLWRCWTGPRRRSTASTAPRSSHAFARVRRRPTSTSRSSKPSTRSCASNSASGTRRPRWYGTWSPASTRR